MDARLRERFSSWRAEYFFRIQTEEIDQVIISHNLDRVLAVNQCMKIHSMSRTQGVSSVADNQIFSVHPTYCEPFCPSGKSNLLIGQKSRPYALKSDP